MYNIDSKKNNILETIKFVVLMLTHVDDIDMGLIPHPMYIAEKFNASFVGLDNSNQKRVEEYCKKNNISIKELIEDRNVKMGLNLKSP